MANLHSHQQRPQIHLLASEADQISDLALRIEHQQPEIAAMLLAEIERAQLHGPETMPAGSVRLNSRVVFVDERSSELREVLLVLPAQANIAEGRISILTPMGVALYGLQAGQSIDWPDRNGDHRPVRILRVIQLDGDGPA